MTIDFDHRKFLALMEELNMGIVPRQVFVENDHEGGDPFHGLTEKEARKLKRKFRKLKRKLQKELPGRRWTNTRVREFIFWRLVEEQNPKIRW